MTLEGVSACKRGGWVPFQLSGAGKLLLRMHVQQQVSDAVAVAKLVVIPGENRQMVSV